MRDPHGSARSESQPLTASGTKVSGTSLYIYDDVGYCPTGSVSAGRSLPDGPDFLIFFDTGTANMPNSETDVAIIFGTRPECIKMAPVVKAVAAHPRLRPVVINSSQHKDLLTPFLSTFALDVDYDLDIMKASQTPNMVLSAALQALDDVLEKVAPGMVLVQGDTTTALAGALAAFHKGIPVGHVEAGLRTGNIMSPFPEEMNRRVIGNLASIHFAATPDNEQNLLREDVAAEKIAVCGNPVVDAVKFILDRHDPSPETQALIDEAGDRKLVLMTTHRRESFGEMMERNLRAVGRFVADNEDIFLAFPVHPNPNVRKAVASHLSAGDRVKIIDPLGYGDFIQLMQRSAFLISDSGGVQEEAACLGKKLIVLRKDTERPEVVRAGIAKLIGEDPEVLEQLLGTVETDADWAEATRTNRDLYGIGDTGSQIADLVTSFLARRA